MRHLILSFALTLAIVAPAQASGGLSCEAKDKSLTFSVGSSLSRGGGMFLNIQADLEIHRTEVPRDLRQLALSGEDITQRWLHGRDLKLRFYRERDNKLPHGYIDLVVEAREAKNDESSYRGSYVLSVYSLPSEQASEGKRVTLRGNVTCSVE